MSQMEIQNLIDEIERLRDALEACAEAKMPGEARRIARNALMPTKRIEQVPSYNNPWRVDGVHSPFYDWDEETPGLEGYEDEPALTNAEQKAQGERCGCRGYDDYCVCQNSIDGTTRAARAANPS